MVIAVLASGAGPAAAIADCDATVQGTQLNCNLNGTTCSVYTVAGNVSFCTT